MEELRVSLETKDIRISNLKVKLQYFSLEGPSASDQLKSENAELKAQVVSLTGEVKGLTDKIKYLTKRILNYYST